jgi:hypothetical protein
LEEVVPSQDHSAEAEDFLRLAAVAPGHLVEAVVAAHPEAVVVGPEDKLIWSVVLQVN